MCRYNQALQPGKRSVNDDSLCLDRHANGWHRKRNMFRFYIGGNRVDGKSLGRCRFFYINMD